MGRAAKGKEKRAVWQKLKRENQKMEAQINSALGLEKKKVRYSLLLFIPCLVNFNGAVPLSSRFRCENSLLSVLKRSFIQVPFMCGANTI